MLHARSGGPASEPKLRDEIAQGLAEASPDALVVVDERGVISFVNGRCEALFGYTLGELVGSPLSMLVPERHRPAHARYLSAYVAAPRARPMGAARALRGRRRDGTEVPIEVALSPVPTSRGTFFVAAVRDASERVRTEEALRRSEEALARAQRAARLGTWDWDLRTNRVDRSEGLFALFGVSPDSVEPERWSLLRYIPTVERERVQQVVDAAALEGRPYTLEHRIVRADGEERIVLQHGEPIVEGGRTIRMLGTILDVTDRRRAEMDREAAVLWLRAVFERSPVGLVLVHGPSGDELEPNERAVELLGRPQLGERIPLFDPTEAPIPDHLLPGRRALRGELAECAEYLVRGARGGFIPILAGATPIRDSGGAIAGAVVLVQDITSTKELERLRAEWGAVVAHDLRQPLNAIVLHAELLLMAEDNRGADESWRQGLERIQNAARRLDRMIGDLTDLSKLDARRLELVRRRVDAVALARESCDRFALEAPRRAIELRVVGQGFDGRLEAQLDPDRFVQILDNLVSNAIKYGDPGTPVTIVLERVAEELSVGVTNIGRGIAPDELPRLFERFQRLPGAKTSRMKGTGLGLHIARRLVEAHGGRLAVESTPGGTTTFCFTLPVVDPRSAGDASD